LHGALFTVDGAGLLLTAVGVLEGVGVLGTSVTVLASAAVLHATALAFLVGAGLLVTVVMSDGEEFPQVLDVEKSAHHHHQADDAGISRARIEFRP
jgi:hypothetical protein